MTEDEVIEELEHNLVEKLNFGCELETLRSLMAFSLKQADNNTFLKQPLLNTSLLSCKHIVPSNTALLPILDYYHLELEDGLTLGRLRDLHSLIYFDSKILESSESDQLAIARLYELNILLMIYYKHFHNQQLQKPKTQSTMGCLLESVSFEKMVDGAALHSAICGSTSEWYISGLLRLLRWQRQLVSYALRAFGREDEITSEHETEKHDGKRNEDALFKPNTSILTPPLIVHTPTVFRKRPNNRIDGEGEKALLNGMTLPKSLPPLIKQPTTNKSITKMATTKSPTKTKKRAKEEAILLAPETPTKPKPVINMTDENNHGDDKESVVVLGTPPRRSLFVR